MSRWQTPAFLGDHRRRKVAIAYAIAVSNASVITIKYREPWDRQGPRENRKRCGITVIHGVDYCDPVFVKIITERASQSMYEQVLCLALNDKPPFCKEYLAAYSPRESL
jgi:hypothetical protein